MEDNVNGILFQIYFDDRQNRLRMQLLLKLF